MWKRKENEPWFVLEVKGDPNNLTDEQSLKIQEMIDNKTHNSIQSKYSRILVLATIILSFELLEKVISRNFNKWFLLSFDIFAIFSFLYFSSI